MMCSSILPANSMPHGSMSLLPLVLRRRVVGAIRHRSAPAPAPTAVRGVAWDRTMNPAAISILVLVVVAGIALVRWAVGASAQAWNQDHATRRPGPDHREGDPGSREAASPGRPRAPSPWIVATVLLLLLGVVVAPRLL